MRARSSHPSQSKSCHAHPCTLCLPVHVERAARTLTRDAGDCPWLVRVLLCAGTAAGPQQCSHAEGPAGGAALQQRWCREQRSCDAACRCSPGCAGEHAGCFPPAQVAKATHIIISLDIHNRANSGPRADIWGLQLAWCNFPFLGDAPVVYLPASFLPSLDA